MIKVQIHSHETTIDTIKSISNINDWLRGPVSEMIVFLHRRIHVDGLASDGSQIGQYSTKPMLIGKSSFRTQTTANAFFKEIKKSNKKHKNKEEKPYKWVTYKGKKLLVLPGGYKRLRELNGRIDNDKIVASFSRQLENDYAVIGLQSGYGIGFNNALNAKKAEGLETRTKKKIFAFTDDETQLFVSKIQREIDLIIDGQ